MILAIGKKTFFGREWNEEWIYWSSLQTWERNLWEESVEYYYRNIRKTFLPWFMFERNKKVFCLIYTIDNDTFCKECARFVQLEKCLVLSCNVRCFANPVLRLWDEMSKRKDWDLIANKRHVVAFLTDILSIFREGFVSIHLSSDRCSCHRLSCVWICHVFLHDTHNACFTNLIHPPQVFGSLDWSA